MPACSRYSRYTPIHAYIVPDRVNLHINLNAYERLLNKLGGQSFCAITLMSKLVRINANEQEFTVHINFTAQEVSEATWEKPNQACQNQWPSGLAVSMNFSQLMSATLLIPLSSSRFVQITEITSL